MIISPIKAIRAKCLDCCYGQREEVKYCSAAECPLYAFRFGKNPYRKQREMSDEERKVLGDRLKQARKNNVNFNEKFGESESDDSQQ